MRPAIYPLVLSAFCYAAISVVLHLILGDWRKFNGLLGQLTNTSAWPDSVPTMASSRMSDGLLGLALIGVHLLAGKHLEGEQPRVQTLTHAVIALAFLVVLLGKHIAAIAYAFIQPDYWLP